MIRHRWPSTNDYLQTTTMTDFDKHVWNHAIESHMLTNNETYERDVQQQNACLMNNQHVRWHKLFTHGTQC
jgi:hypothetical protein